MGRLRWGDAADDEDVLPPSTTVGPNEKGIITKTEYFRNSKGDAVKRTVKIQVIKTETKVYEITAERKQWPKFGHAKVNNEGVTIQSIDDIQFERTNKPKKQDDKKDFKASLQGGDKAQVTQSLAEILAEKRRNREMLRAKGLLAEAEMPPDEDGITSMQPKKEGVYVPPSRKAGATMGEKRDFDNSVRVSNLSENVTEHDLRELFTPFGDIARVYVAYDRDTGEHRGFAFVNFRLRSSADRAVAALDGYGYDNLILRVEIATPRADRT